MLDAELFREEQKLDAELFRLLARLLAELNPLSDAAPPESSLSPSHPKAASVWWNMQHLIFPEW